MGPEDDAQLRPIGVRAYISLSSGELLPDRYPVRLMSRSLTVFAVRVMTAQAAPHGDNYERMMVFQAVAAANLDHLPIESEGLAAALRGDADAARLMRPVSVLAIAQSLNTPYETTRMRAHQLVEAGFCTRAEAGLLLSNAWMKSVEARHSRQAVKAEGIALLHQLAALGYDFGLTAMITGTLDALAFETSVQAVPIEIAAHLFTVTILRILEQSKGVFGSVIEVMIWFDVSRENMRPVMASRDLSWRYGAMEDGPVPDDLRVPVSIRSTAKRLSIPYETARRASLALCEKGHLVRARGGLISPATMVDDDAPGVALQRAGMVQFARTVSELRKLGCVFPVAEGAVEPRAADC